MPLLRQYLPVMPHCKKTVQTDRHRQEKPTASRTLSGAHLVLPDMPISIATNVPQNQKAYPVFLGGHFFAPESYSDTNQNTNFETN